MTYEEKVTRNKARDKKIDKWMAVVMLMIIIGGILWNVFWR